MRPSIILCSSVAYLSLTGLLPADVKLPAIFGDHMVLQQSATLPVWGTADPGEAVTVTVGTETGAATAAPDGKWMVKLTPLPADTPPLTMTIAGKNKRTFTDVLVGDVWLCGGQSNMAFTLNVAHNWTEVIPQANDPQLRFFTVGGHKSLSPQGDLSGSWVLCTPDTAKKFSAVGYFFGRELRSTLNRPIGLISSNAGGTPAQAWSTLASLRRDPVLKNYTDAYDAQMAAYPAAQAAYPAQMAAYQDAREKYKQGPGGDYFAKITQYNSDVEKAQAAHQPLPPKPVPIVPLPVPPKDPEGDYAVASGLYNGMIAPLVPFAIKGAIWYQGEANVHAPVEYRNLFTALITGWREAWGQGDFPFLFAQLENTNGSGDENWPLLRESQAAALSLPATGMVSITDIGTPSDVHSKDKLDVGKRFALAARRVAYGQDVIASGPLYDAMKVEGGTIRLTFTQIGGGLVIGSAPWTPQGIAPLPTTSLAGFAIAGADQKWHAADAKIDGDTVLVSSPQVPQPVAIRYGWQNLVQANLYNKDGLPAPPFRTDTWPEPLARPAPPANP